MSQRKKTSNVHCSNDNYCPDRIKDKMVIQTIRNLGMQYKKIKNSYTVYCSCCDKYVKLDERKFKQVKYSGMCPSCFRPNTLHDYEKGSSSEYRHCYEFIRYRNEGFMVEIYWKFGKPIKKSEVTKVLKFEGNNKYVRYIYLAGMGWNVRVRPWWYSGYRSKESNENWRKVTSYNYDYGFIDIQEGYGYENKKEFLEKTCGFITKSNQKKLAIDNLFNIDQLKAMVEFDIKDAEDIYKARKYIRENANHIDTNCNHNVYLLRYLIKNKITLDQYKDYEQICLTLNKKPDKPKDFALWHDRLSAQIEAQKNKKYQKGIKKQYNKLKNKTFVNEEIVIKPFECFEEMSFVSKHLHNCLSRLYVKPYANGSTELYYMMVNDKPIIAIEITGKKLMQCYADHNSLPSKKDKAIINKWMRKAFA